MAHPSREPKVILRDCSTYDVEKIRAIVREGLDELGLKPQGRTLVKPNIVAAGPLFEHAHTRVELMEGLIAALRDRDAGMSELAIGERCAITVPTRFVFKASGYDAFCARANVKQYRFEEVPQVEIPLTHEGRLRDYLYTPEPVAKADFFVNVPKFKAHPWTTVTFSMKNYIGIQDDRHRLIDHDHKLNNKVADLQYIVQPQLIVIDAITAGEGRMLTPIPYPLGLVIMGNNQAAIDAVCCRIIGIDPATVDHIRIPHERGFGPIDLEQIQITGDVSMSEAKTRAKAFRSGLIRVERYFEGTSIAAYAGPPPEGTGTDYCWGGCPGAIEEAIEVLRLFDQQTDQKLPKLHIVFGAYPGEIPAKPGEKVLFIGDCTTWSGSVDGKPIQIRSTYKDRSTLDPRNAEHEDIYAKMSAVLSRFWLEGDQQVLRFEGCPVSVGELILILAHVGGLKNPYFDRDQVLEFNLAYLKWRGSVMMKRATGELYQKEGVADRGAARPVIER